MTKGSKVNVVALIPVQIPLVYPGQELVRVLSESFQEQKLLLKNGDILAVASKVVSVCEGRTARLEEVRVSGYARRVARSWRMDERLVSLVLKEADKVVGGVRGFLLTIKDGFLTANAGIDLKNCPRGTVALWPKNPDASAKRLRSALEKEYGVRLGVSIVDSRVTPLRLGTTGVTIGASGFVPVQDERGKPDIFGRKVKVTQTSVADDIAAAAHLLMGERDQMVGAVVIRNAPILLSRQSDGRREKLRIDRCLISSNLRNANRRH